MDPSSNESLGMQLPAPVETEPVKPVNDAESSSQTAEQAPAAPEKSGALPAPGGGTAVAVPPIMLPALPASPLPVQAGAASTAAPPPTLPMAADDDDLIEKEWVNKAKAIIEKNRDDPYKQSEELTVVKADYMQKRYNKSIKVSK